MKQTFLQTQIREPNRDAFWFHSIAAKDSEHVESLRFTRAIFGLGESPFLLNTTVNIHLDASKETYLELVENNEEIQESLYVNKIVVGIPGKEYVENIKIVATTLFGDEKFDLHEWNSKFEELEVKLKDILSETTYAKEDLGTNLSDSKI